MLCPKPTNANKSPKFPETRRGFPSRSCAPRTGRPVPPLPLLTASWSPKGNQLPGWLFLPQVLSFGYSGGLLLQQLLHPDYTGGYLKEHVQADCVQPLADRFESYQTTQFAIDATVRCLYKDEKFFRPCTAHKDTVFGLPSIPQAIRCDKGITARQIICWPAAPRWIVDNYPVSRRLYRQTNSIEISQLVEAAQTRENSLPRTQIPTIGEKAYS